MEGELHGTGGFRHPELSGEDVLFCDSPCPCHLLQFVGTDTSDYMGPEENLRGINFFPLYGRSLYMGDPRLFER